MRRGRLRRANVGNKAMRQLWLLALAMAICANAPAQEPDPAASEIWQKVHASVLADAPILAGAGVIALEAPQRAEDAAVVPIAIRAQFAQSSDRYIERVWLLVDKNPSPIAAVFDFTPASGRAEIETRIRIEDYTHVRAVARTNDGRLYMATRYVKAAGGCSAPAGKDALAAQANLGKMRLRVDDRLVANQPAWAQLMVSHPNDSGLAMDQLTRTYAPPHFVRRVEVTYAGNSVLRADVDFSISENPNFRFYFVPADDGQLEARVVDSQDLEFSARLRLDPGRIAEVPGSRRPD